MKVLFIGGTGIISTSVSRACIARGIELHLLTRGQRPADIPGARFIQGDIHQMHGLPPAIRETHWDSVVDWIAYTRDDVERDIELFRGRTQQYIFISSASAYQKPPAHPIITESTPLCNPFWEYSRNKIACEERLNRAYRDEGFPMTIVRPSHTYDNVIPVAIGGWNEYTVIDRIKSGRPLIVHGDGSSLWVLTHAEDFAKGFAGLIGHPRAIGDAFHITSDEVLTWDQIYETVAAAVGCSPRLVHIASEFLTEHDESLRGGLLGDKARSVIFDNSKIKNVVPEYRATIPFHIGIRRTLAWFDADPSRKLVRQETHEWMDRVLEAYLGKGARE